MVIDCKSLYNCISSRPTLAELTVVPSIIHLKIKFYTKKGGVATVNANIEANRRVFYSSVKGYESIIPNKKPRVGDKPTHEESKPQANVNSVDLDARFTKEELKNREASRLETSYFVRPISDSDFELIPLDEDPNKGLKIGKNFPDLSKKQLVACLR